jgi:predicted MPP superfamily phosphohydrolase
MPLPSLLNRRRFLQLGAASLLGAGAVGAYSWLIEPHWVEVVRRDLPIAGLPAALEGQTLVQLSDLHVGPEVDDDYLIASFARVARLQPALLVLTGDYMTCKGDEEIDHALRVLAHLQPARLATLAVLGNHDYARRARRPDVADRLCAGLRDLGIEVLRNARRDVAGLSVIGLDDLWAGRFRPRAALADLDPDGAHLVLCHNPDAVDRPGWCGYRGWVLAGHTHGGQVKLPLLGPPRLSVRNRRYTAGAFDLGDGRRLYINRALGHLLRVRFNVRPEITAFTLRREAGPEAGRCHNTEPSA